MKLNPRSKSISISLIPALLFPLLAGCSMAGSQDTIHVISRESGSGTEEAFNTLLDIERPLPEMEITNSTAVMLTSVKQDDQALGYVSLGSLSKDVQALQVNGISPSQENVENGTYPLVRSFLVTWKENPADTVALSESSDESRNHEALRQDFLDYLNSPEAAKILFDAGYVPDSSQTKTSTKDAVRKPAPADQNQPEGTLMVGGSSSIAPVMEVLAENYEKENPQAHIEVAQSDSTTGINNAGDGTYDIGMSSRDLKEDETKTGLQSDVLALDCIVCINNRSNPIKDLSTREVQKIYEGNINSWDDFS